MNTSGRVSTVKGRDSKLTQTARAKTLELLTEPSAATQLMLIRVWNLTLGACAAPQQS